MSIFILRFFSFANSVYISSGIHRTGLLTYIILKYRGFTEEEIMAKIKEIRIETFLGFNQTFIERAKNLG